MSEARSVIAHRNQLEASQKFDYFIAGLTGALCAYIAQSWKPQKLVHLGPPALEPVALLLLFAAAVAGFKRIEWTVVTLQLNTEWLRISEKCGAMAGVAMQSGLAMFSESGDFLSPVGAMANYEAVSDALPEIRNRLDGAAKKALLWYNWRNRFLLTGFACLVGARFAVLFW